MINKLADISRTVAAKPFSFKSIAVEYVNRQHCRETVRISIPETHSEEILQNLAESYRDTWLSTFVVDVFNTPMADKRPVPPTGAKPKPVPGPKPPTTLPTTSQTVRQTVQIKPLPVQAPLPEKSLTAAQVAAKALAARRERDRAVKDRVQTFARSGSQAAAHYLLATANGSEKRQVAAVGPLSPIGEPQRASTPRDTPPLSPAESTIDICSTLSSVHIDSSLDSDDSVQIVGERTFPSVETAEATRTIEREEKHKVKKIIAKIADLSREAAGK